MEMRASELPGQRKVIDRFLVECLEACAGSIVMSAELFEAFVIFCRVRNIPICTEALFYQQMARKLGPASHCFGPNRDKRGRSGWRLKLEVICGESVGSNQNGTGEAR
jgi:hypothetical protein